MVRVRISTTVDADRLGLARSLCERPDSELIDRALALFIETVENERERRALLAQPYEADPELQMPAVSPEGFDGLPYDGEIPEHVLRLAEARRRRRPQ